MPSEKSSRVAERKGRRNRPIRTATRTYVKKAQEAIASGDPESAQQSTREAIKALDKAAQKGVVHKNNAARRKSRLMAKLNALETPAG